MAEKDTDEDAGKAKRKSSKMPLILGVLMALVFGGGGFYATYSGMLDGLLGVSDDHAEAAGGADHGADDGHGSASAGTAIEFVPVEPILVSLSGGGGARHLRFGAELEVATGQAATVAALMPRVLDALNGYLRAVRIKDLEKPTALLTLRAHLLRRVQLVVGYDRVKDLLVTEFVLN